MISEMPPLFGSTSLFIGEIDGRVPVEYIYPTANRDSSRKPCLSGFLEENAIKLGALVMRFGLWLHLVCPCGDISSESSFDL